MILTSFPKNLSLFYFEISWDFDNMKKKLKELEERIDDLERNPYNRFKVILDYFEENLSDDLNT